LTRTRSNYFFLYSDDHDPLHIHVRYQGAEWKALITYGRRGGVNVEWKRVKGNLTAQTFAKAEGLVKAKGGDIRKKWNDIHILHKHVKPIAVLRLK
jgi:hypothetical protein